MICTNCGRINPDGTKFCAFCGSKMLSETENIKCTNCGNENEQGSMFCWSCGVPISSSKSSSQTKTPSQPKTPTQSEDNLQNNASNPAPNIIINQSNPNHIPPEYQPISMWGYFGYELLFAIPVLGFILLIVFSFGATRNVNLKNFARSYFCLLIIVIILIVLIVLFGIGGGLSSMRYYF